MLPLELTFHGLDPSDALTAHVRKHLERLQHVDARIVHCRVAVERRNHHHRHGEHTRIAIELRRPGGDLVVTHEGEETDAYAALGHAFDAMRRQLVDTKAAIRGR